MKSTGKKHKKVQELLKAATLPSLKSTLEFIVKNAHAKFDETVDADIVLGIDASKGEQTVRGSILLPHGIGKKVRVIAFAKGAHAEEAKEAGADYVGADD